MGIVPATPGPATSKVHANGKVTLYDKISTATRDHERPRFSTTRSHRSHWHCMLKSIGRARTQTTWRVAASARQNASAVHGYRGSGRDRLRYAVVGSPRDARPMGSHCSARARTHKPSGSSSDATIHAG